MVKDASGRDQTILSLARIFRDRPEPARQAGERLAVRIKETIVEKNAVERSKREDLLKLLPVAQEMVLDRMAGPPAMWMDSGLKERPKGFDPIGWGAGMTIPVWAQRGCEAVGRWDGDLTELLFRLADWLGAAHTGKFGDDRAEGTVDLALTSAYDAYVHSQSVPLRHPTRPSSPRKSVDQIKTELDPDRAQAIDAFPWSVLAELTREAVLADPQRQQTSGQWWDTALLALLGLYPDFDPPSVGLTEMPPWDVSDPKAPLHTTRREVLEVLEGYDKPRDGGPTHGLWRLARRACRHLKGDGTGAQPEHDAVTLASVAHAPFDAGREPIGGFPFSVPAAVPHIVQRTEVLGAADGVVPMLNVTGLPEYSTSSYHEFVARIGSTPRNQRVLLEFQYLLGLHVHYVTSAIEHEADATKLHPQTFAHNLIFVLQWGRDAVLAELPAVERSVADQRMQRGMDAVTELLDSYQGHPLVHILDRANHRFFHGPWVGLWRKAQRTASDVGLLTKLHVQVVPPSLAPVELVHQTGPSGDEQSVAEEQVTVTEAAERLQKQLPGLTIELARSRVSIAASRGAIQHNGQKGVGRRLAKGSVASWVLDQVEEEIKKHECV